MIKNKRIPQEERVEYVSSLVRLLYDENEEVLYSLFQTATYIKNNKKYPGRLSNDDIFSIYLFFAMYYVRSKNEKKDIST